MSTELESLQSFHFSKDDVDVIQIDIENHFDLGAVRRQSTTPTETHFFDNLLESFREDHHFDYSYSDDELLTELLARLLPFDVTEHIKDLLTGEVELSEIEDDLSAKDIGFYQYISANAEDLRDAFGSVVAGVLQDKNETTLVERIKERLGSLLDHELPSRLTALRGKDPGSWRETEYVEFQVSNNRLLSFSQEGDISALPRLIKDSCLADRLALSFSSIALSLDTDEELDSYQESVADDIDKVSIYREVDSYLSLNDILESELTISMLFAGDDPVETQCHEAFLRLNTTKEEFETPTALDTFQYRLENGHNLIQGSADVKRLVEDVDKENFAILVKSLKNSDPNGSLADLVGLLASKSAKEDGDSALFQRYLAILDLYNGDDEAEQQQALMDKALTIALNVNNSDFFHRVIKFAPDHEAAVTYLPFVTKLDHSVAQATLLGTLAALKAKDNNKLKQGLQPDILVEAGDTYLSHETIEAHLQCLIGNGFTDEGQLGSEILASLNEKERRFFIEHLSPEQIAQVLGIGGLDLRFVEQSMDTEVLSYDFYRSLLDELLVHRADTVYGIINDLTGLMSEQPADPLKQGLGTLFSVPSASEGQGDSRLHILFDEDDFYDFFKYIDKRTNELKIDALLDQAADNIATASPKIGQFHI